MQKIAAIIVSIDIKLLLAPFQGITDKTYRNAFARNLGGFDEMYTPFVSGVGKGSINPSKLRDLLPLEENVITTVPQIISNKHEEILLFAKAMEENGFSHINLNMGCPFSRIANKKRGCGILPYPEEIQLLFDTVFKEISIELSVKTRLGYKKPDEIIKVLEIFNGFPLKHIILHPRTGLQIYSGDADPEAYSDLLSLSKHKLIYNGDVFNLSQFDKLKKIIPEQTDWMLGRGALMNPFLPSEIKGILYSDDEKRIMLRNFHEELFHSIKDKVKSNAKLIGRMKAI